MYGLHGHRNFMAIFGFYPGKKATLTNWIQNVLSNHNICLFVCLVWHNVKQKLSALHFSPAMTFSTRFLLARNYVYGNFNTQAQSIRQLLRNESHMKTKLQKPNRKKQIVQIFFVCVYIHKWSENVVVISSETKHSENYVHEMFKQFSVVDAFDSKRKTFYFHWLLEILLQWFCSQPKIWRAFRLRILVDVTIVETL